LANKSSSDISTDTLEILQVSGGSYLIFEQTLQTQVAAGSQHIIIDNQLISVSLVTVAKPSMF